MVCLDFFIGTMDSPKIRRAAYGGLRRLYCVAWASRRMSPLHLAGSQSDAFPHVTERIVPPRSVIPQPSTERRKVDLRLVLDEAHYREVVELGLLSARTSIWLSTANIKDAHVESPIGSRARARGRYQSLFEWLKAQSDAGLDVRILHAGKPSRALLANPAWGKGETMHRSCPRVHLKMIAVDGRYLYIGSANFTGAGFGAKSAGRRNFEAGVVTDDPLMLDELQGLFDAIWTGRCCANCQLRAQCPAPIDELLTRRTTFARRNQPKASVERAKPARPDEARSSTGKVGQAKKGTK